VRKRVLFVCVENAGRSQMAEGFARALGGDAVEAASAGSKPLGRLNPVVVAAMAEKGIDISGQCSKGLDAVPPEDWDALVTMGCGDACPNVRARRRVDWALPDPKGKDLPAVRAIRQDIEHRVMELLEELKEDRP
jgi:protein-tyrosine-phosphatase